MVVTSEESQRVKPADETYSHSALSSSDQRLLEDLKSKLEIAVSARDVQEAAELVFEIKS